jgi:hypothetical protein
LSQDSVEDMSRLGFEGDVVLRGYHGLPQHDAGAFWSMIRVFRPCCAGS